MKHQRKLRNFIVNPSFQYKYIFWISSTGLLMICLVNVIFYFLLKENYDLLVELSPMTEEAKTQLYSELRNLILMLSVGSLFFLTMVSIVGLVFSHRAAGPIWHIHRVVKEILLKDNYSARIHLRPKDEFKEVAEDLNKVFDKLAPKQST